MSLAPDRLAIGIRRHFTSAGVHPYDQVEWEKRDPRISNWKDGSVAFEQKDVEIPASWSLNATNIVAQKYFRGTLGTAERETSLRQVIDVSPTRSPIGAFRAVTSSMTRKPKHSATNSSSSSSPSAQHSTARCGSTSA